MSINYINAIATGKKTYDIYTANTDKDNIINAAYNKVINEALPPVKAGLQDASDNLEVSDYLDKNTKKAPLTIGNNHVSLKNLQTQINTANGEISRCLEDLEEVEKALEDINIPTIDEYPTIDTDNFTINKEIDSNIGSIKLTNPQLIPNRMYNGKQLIYKITCEIIVDTKLFDTNEGYKDGVEIAIPLPIGTNQALLPLQLEGIWQSTDNDNQAQSFDPFPMFTRKGVLMAICFQQSNNLIIKVFQSGMIYPCNRLFFSLEYVLINENQIEGDETT